MTPLPGQVLPQDPGPGSFLECVAREEVQDAASEVQKGAPLRGPLTRKSLNRSPFPPAMARCWRRTKWRAKASVCSQGGCQGGSHDGRVVWVPLCAVTGYLFLQSLGACSVGWGVGWGWGHGLWLGMYVKLGMNRLTHQLYSCQVQPAAVTACRPPPPFLAGPGLGANDSAGISPCLDPLGKAGSPGAQPGLPGRRVLCQLLPAPPQGGGVVRHRTGHRQSYALSSPKQ